MFGSETCGDFTNYRFQHITITGAGKSGLGMVSSDGAHISNVVYDDITMSGHINSLIMQKVWNRDRCGTHPSPGSITDVHYSNINGSTTSSSFSPTLWGLDNGSHDISNVTFTNANLTVPGGGSGNPDTLPSNRFDYNPNSIGPRPAFGMFMHNVSGITFTGSSFHARAGDSRPALDDIAGANITVDTVTASRSTGAQDVHFNGTAGYCVRNSPALRVTATGSTQACGTPTNDFALSVAPTTQSVTPGATATYTVHTSVLTGAPDAITLTGAGRPAGAAISFGTNPVSPGSDSIMTVTTSTTTPTGPATLTVTGTDSFGTQHATATLTVGPGGGGLTITGLTVADTANAGHWSLQSSLAAGSTQYGDRTFTLTAVPTALRGSQWIRTANSSKSATANPLVTFTISQQAVVSVAVDTRLGRRSWMDSSWVDTGTHLTNSESTPRSFEVFQRTFPAGQVALGPNAGPSGSSNYTIVVT